MNDRSLRDRVDDARELMAVIRRLLNVAEQLASVIDDPADPREVEELAGYGDAVAVRAAELVAVLAALDLFVATEVAA